MYCSSVHYPGADTRGLFNTLLLLMINCLCGGVHRFEDPDYSAYSVGVSIAVNHLLAGQ